MELHNNDESKEEDAEITTHKKRYISPEERHQIINELRLIPKNYFAYFAYFQKCTYLHKKDNKLLMN